MEDELLKITHHPFFRIKIIGDTEKVCMPMMQRAGQDTGLPSDTRRQRCGGAVLSTNWAIDDNSKVR